MNGAALRVDRDRSVTGRRVLAALAVTAPAMTACDPIWSLSGAFFPAWLICMVGGLVVAIILRTVIARLGLEPYIGPRLLMYLLLYLASTCTLWLLFFSH